MNKVVKIILSIISSVIIFIVMIPIVLGIMLQIAVVQGIAVDYVSEFLSQKAQAKISVGRVNIKFFNKASLGDVYMGDQRGDTMIYVKDLTVNVSGINFITGRIALGNVTLKDGNCFLYRDSLGMMNIQKVFEAFKSEDPEPSTSDFMLTAGEVNLVNFHFKLKYAEAQEQPSGINYSDMDVRNIYFQARDVDIYNFDMNFEIEHLSCREKCGFYLQHLGSKAVFLNGQGWRMGDVKIQTPRSVLECSKVDFLYDSWYAYLDFVSKVTLDIWIKPSRVAYQTISYFTPRAASGVMTSVEFQGWVYGPICDFRGQLSRVHTDNTDLSVKFGINGLPDIQNTWFDIELASLTTNGYDAQKIIFDITGQDKLAGISDILGRSGNIAVSGNFNGRIGDFNSDAVLSTRQGTIKGQLQLISDTTHESEFRIVGRTSASGFDVGSILGVKQLGRITFDAGVDAKLGNGALNLTTDANINKMHWAGVPYFDIMMDGSFSGRKFVGEVISKDANFAFVTNGMFDFNGKMPTYDFDMILTKANLVSMGINKRDSVSLLSARFTANATGSTLDNVNGKLLVDSIMYINQIDTVNTGEILVRSVNVANSKELSFSSDFMDAQLTGGDSYYNMFSYLGNSIARYIPSFPEPSKVGLTSPIMSAGGSAAKGRQNASLLSGDEFEEDGYYMITANVKKANNVAAIFLPGLNVASGTHLNFYFSPVLDKFSLTFKSDYIERQTMLLEDINLSGRNYKDSISVLMSVGYVGVGKLEFENVSAIGGVKNNTIAFGVRFKNEGNGSFGFVKTTTTAQRTLIGNMPQLDVKIYDSELTLKGNRWLVGSSNVLLDTTGITIRKFNVRDSLQSLMVDGKVGRTGKDTLSVKLNNFDISPISVLGQGLGYNLNGRVSGMAKGVAILADARFFAKLNFNDVELNGYKLGGAVFTSDLDKQNRKISMKLVADDGLEHVTGDYDLTKKYLNLGFNFDTFDLVLLQPMLKGILSQTNGTASVKMSLSGRGSNLALDGLVDVKNYSAMVDFTKVRYDLKGPIKVKNNRFELNQAPLTDNLNGVGTISAWFDSDYFQNLRFGVDANFQNILGLNTTAKDDLMFYGKVFGSGSFKVWGNERNINMEIVAQSSDKSSFVLPLPDVASISEADFITFLKPTAVNTDQQTLLHRRENRQKQMAGTDKSSSDLDIKLDLHVLPNTLATIILDGQTGSSVDGRGEGRISMHINPSSNTFTMSGPLEIERGVYRFVLPELVIDKRFAIEKSGQLMWNGDPANPIINVDAIYKIKTSLAPLNPGLLSNANNSVTVDCGINLSGNMLSPTIKLSITAPSADVETQSLISNTLNTEEATTTQFLSLLLNRSFMPDFNDVSNVGTMTGSLVGVTISEFLSNQISSLVSSDKFNFRFGYRPSDNINYGDEVNFEIGSELIQNVLSVEVGGNYNTGNNPTQNSRTPFTGDANLTWTINKAGTLKLKGFTRAIDRFDETQGLQESGVGVYYRQDFQNLPDLKDRYKKWREAVKNKKRKREK